MGSPTIGAQTAAVIGFIAMVMILGPVMDLASPSSFSQSYFGTNGIVNSTYHAYTANFSLPILQTANTTTGFQAAGNLLNSAFSPLAFIYGGLGLFWKSLLNLPTLIYIMITSLSSNVAVFLPTLIGTVFIVIVFSYIVIGDFYKLLSMWMKSDAENVGQ